MREVEPPLTDETISDECTCPRSHSEEQNRHSALVHGILTPGFSSPAQYGLLALKQDP